MLRWRSPRMGKRDILCWWLEDERSHHRWRTNGRVWRYTGRSRWRSDYYADGVAGFERVYEGWSLRDAARALERRITG